MEEERSYVQKCIDRILDLGGQVKNEAKKEAPVCYDALEFVKYDLQVSKDGLAWLGELVECAKDDYKTYDILKEYYKKFTLAPSVKTAGGFFFVERLYN